MSRSHQRPLNTEKEQSNGNGFWKRRLPRLTRWLHIYLSMISFVIVFFFAVTGLTLNHADKFGDQVHTKQGKGKLDVSWVNTPDTSKVAKLNIVEYLRNTHGIKATLSDFRIDDDQCTLTFKGPGYAADIFIDRAKGSYDIAETSAGFVGLINDLHKGRDTGPGWKIFIDVAAIFMSLVSLTGIILLVYLKKRRASGLIIAGVGLLIAWLVYAIWIK